MIKGLKTSIGSIIALIVIIVSGYIFYRWATYIDETVIEGKAYGFSLGDTKLETYYKAQAIYQNQDVYILYPMNESGYGPHRQINFQAEEFKILEGQASWELYYDEGFFDSLKLTFENGNLANIHRHRKKFELP